MKERIVISSSASISPLGHREEEISTALWSKYHHLSQNVRDDWMGQLSSTTEEELQSFVDSHPKYKLLDRTAHLAMWASNKAWQKRLKKGAFPRGLGGVNIGSSRGATGILEERLLEYEQKGGLPGVHTSPTTTLGAVSSWVGKALNLNGPAFSHSVTCSTALYALGNASAWIKSGMVDFFVAGGTEAPLTKFTIDQMKALGIYSGGNHEYPCRPLVPKKSGENTMVLGEGAAVFVLEKEFAVRASGIKGYTTIEGMGFANENISSPTSISSDGKALQQAMQRALKAAKLDEVDVVIMHAPGTVKGDMAELNAVDEIFDERPVVTSTKWKTGHALGASSALAIEQALFVLHHQKIPPMPFAEGLDIDPGTIKTVMVNSIGFGGNAGSIILSLNMN